MPSKVKVSSWLDKQDTHDSGSGSGSDSESGAETDEVDVIENGEGSGGRSNDDDDDDDEDEDEDDNVQVGTSKVVNRNDTFIMHDDGEDEEEEIQEITWESRLSSLRKVLIDRSEPRKVSILEEEWMISDDHPPKEFVTQLSSILIDSLPRITSRAALYVVSKTLIDLIRRERKSDEAGGGGGVERLEDYVLGILIEELEYSSNGSKTIAPSTIYQTYIISLRVLTLSISSPLSESQKSLISLLSKTYHSIITSLPPSKPTKSNGAGGRLFNIKRWVRSETRKCLSSIKRMDEIVELLVDEKDVKAITWLGLMVDLSSSSSIRNDDFDNKLRERVLGLYLDKVVSTKDVLRVEVYSAIDTILRTISSDQMDKVVNVFEKSLLKNPEASMPIANHIFSIVPIDISLHLPRLLPSILTASKATSPHIRSLAIDLFTTLTSRASSEARKTTILEILSLLSKGKATGVEHKITLVSMLSGQAAEGVSQEIVLVLATMMGKETADPVMWVIGKSLTTHLSWCLEEGHSMPSSTILAAIVKDMSNTKTIVRKHMSDAIGSALWVSGRSTSGWSSAARTWVDNVIPALTGYLKATGTTAAPGVSNVGGPLMEGYVAVAIVLGPMSAQASEKTKNLVAKDPVLSTIINLTPKASFLLSERMQKKIIQENSDRETNMRARLWLLRAMDAVLERQGKGMTLPQRLACAAPIVDLAINAPERQSSTAANATINVILQRQAKIATGMFVDALTTWLKTHKMADESSHVPIGRSVSRVCGNFVSSTSEKSGDNAKSTSLVDTVLLDLLLPSHHPVVVKSDPHAWIDLVISARRDPGQLATQHQEAIMQSLLAHMPPKGSDVGFSEAAYNAVSTLSFVAPDAFVPAFLRQATEDLDPATLAYVGDEAIGIWKTPEGTNFVDVLSQKKDNVAENKNSKNYQQDKWDQQVKKELEAKRAAALNGGLSKVDQALVDKQLVREQAVRDKIKASKAILRRGLDLVASMVRARPQEVVELISTLIDLLFKTAFGKGAFLVGDRAYEVLVAMSALCMDRMGVLRPFIGIALLRSKGVDAVPEHYTEEPLSDLIIRVLHRCLTLSQTTPLDAATFSYLLPLMTRVISLGTTSREHNSDELQEQLTLIVEIISINSSSFASCKFPRLTVIRDLLALARSQPGLAKSAISALIDVSAAIAATANRDEIDALLGGLLAAEGQIRHGVLQALQPLDLTDLDYSNELFLARFDEEHPSARLADRIWEDNGLDVSATFLPDLLPFLSHDAANVRWYAGRAIADATSLHLDQVHAVIESLRALYEEKARIRAPEFDQFGMIIPESLDDTDPYPARSAIASCLTCLAPYLQAAQLDLVFDFLINQEALGDRSQEVRSKLLETGTALIDMHGEGALPTLMAMFEDCLAKSSSSGASGDHVKEAVIILFGRLSKHLDPNDERLPRVIDRLVHALDTPSEIVQSAVGDCLPPLIRMQTETHSSIIDQLMASLTSGSKYAIRRGAAYGLAGAVKGIGLSALHEYEVIERLQEAIEDKKNYQARQGAVFAFDTLSTTLGRTFEPYIISIIPWLLSLFGDTNADVREATADAAKAIMATISGYCVKQILPLLLSGLEEKQWRTKKGSIELLGAMAFCAPKQLSMSLPTIIPQLTSTLTDSHTQVRTAANSSLKRFGEVLSNPEIKRLQPILLKALIDPSSKTRTALAALLGTSFEHYLDSPSLALVIPILDRGLKDRGSEMKMRSVQIVGNMASLTESKDFIPYLDQLMPLVQNVLVDPVPEARATAAKALGTLVERLGEDNFPSLVTTLLQTLRSDTSGVDRQGAAQGLSEVLSGLGMERMEGLLPDIVTYAASKRPYVREGFISLLVYLPATFGQRFAPHLGRIIPPILGGLADESEYVREASMRAGKMIIVNYSAKAIDLLLPELERGMLDGEWRIRQSSIALTGELLYRVAGISGKVEMEEDDAPVQQVDTAKKALTEALGQEGRDRVLATLYIVRQDSVGVVRQSSIHIWKALVHNTPRTTREILPMLISMILNLLGSPSPDQREIASRTLGELCRKNGDRILAEVIPILSKGVVASDDATREGACLAFSEIMDAATDEQIEVHEDTIIEAVRSALVDKSAAVRIAAAQTFDSMMQHIGTKAIDETIPTLLEAMRTPGPASDTALMALREVMSVRAASVFPTLLPTLTVSPISAFNARALASLVTVAGNALSKRLTTVLTPLVKSMESEKDEKIVEAVDEAVRALLASIEDEEGLHSLLITLLGWAKDNNASRRATACKIFGIFCEVQDDDLDASDYRTDWVRQLVTLFDDRSEEVVEAAWVAFDTLIKKVPKEDLEELVVPLRRTIESIGAPGRTVPGFCRPKGVQPIIPILLAGVLSGTQEQREQAAFGIGDIVQRTTEAAIKPYIIQLTGPLIRVISSQAIAAQIKGAILSTLTVLLEEVPQLVRPFHPQLTRTFVKSASDPASLAVRNRAVAGLGELMKHQLRVDPLITELVTAIRSAERDIAPSIAEAIAAVCRTAGKHLGDAAKQAIVEVCEEAFTTKHNDAYCVAIGKIVASLSLHDNEVVESIVRTRIIGARDPTPLRSNCMLQILEINPSLLKDLGLLVECSQALQQAISLDQLAVSRPARDAKVVLGGLI